MRIADGGWPSFHIFHPPSAIRYPLSFFTIARRLKNDLNTITPKHILKELIESTAVGVEPFVEHGSDFARIAGSERSGSQFYRLGSFDGPDDPLDLRQIRRRGTQFVDAQPDQDRRYTGVAAHFTAKTDRDPALVAGINRPLDEP